MSSDLFLADLRRAELHFLDLAAGYEKACGTPGFAEYTFAEADDLLDTKAVLTEITAKLLKHKQRRDALARELRGATELPRLAQWLSGDLPEAALEAEILANLRSADVTLDPAVIEHLRATREGAREALTSGAPPRGPKEAAREAIGTALGRGRTHMGDLEEVLRGRQRATGAVKTATEAEALRLGGPVGAAELLLAVVVALKAELPPSSPLPRSWIVTAMRLCRAHQSGWSHNNPSNASPPSSR